MFESGRIFSFHLLETEFNEPFRLLEIRDYLELKGVDPSLGPFYLIKKLNLSMFLNAIPVPIATTRNGSSAT